MAIAYTLGGIFAAYAYVKLFYELNIDLRTAIHLPLSNLFSQELLPFLASPLTFVGFAHQSVAHTLLVFSGIGASVFTSAEFLSKWRLTKHWFFKRETGPRFNLDWSKNPGMPEPPRATFVIRIGRFLLGVFLTYSFIGIIFFPVFIVFGAYFFYRDIVYIAAFLAAQLLYVGQYFLAPYERWGDDESWGTRWFLVFYIRRKALDNFVTNSSIDFWRVQSVDPKQRNWMAARPMVARGARVMTNAGWFLLIAWLITP